MKDICRNELVEGQKVVTNLGGYTDTLCVCEIVGFTPQKVKLYYKKEIYLKFPKQVAVVRLPVK